MKQKQNNFSEKRHPNQRTHRMQQMQKIREFYPENPMVTRQKLAIELLNRKDNQWIVIP